MGGAWVFPGGAVHGEESPADAGLRELEEEAALHLEDGADALVPFSRWITPAEVKVRFDTFFYVVEASAGARPRVYGAGGGGRLWERPPRAPPGDPRGGLQLAFPPTNHLREVEQAASPAAPHKK